MFKSLKELKAGDSGDIVLLLKNIEYARATNGNTYQKLQVRDREGNETTMLNFDQPVSYAMPAVIQASIRCENYRESVAIKFSSGLPVNADIGLFMPKARINPKDAWGELVDCMKPLRPGLRKIASSIICERGKAFYMQPLNPTGAFSRRCGLIEATLKLVRMAKSAADTLNLDSDLIVSAAMLYYVGRLNTVDVGYNYTKDDLLTGCGIQAYNMVQMKVRDLMEGDDETIKASLNQRDIDLLSHILVSRFHGTQTAIAEAVVLRHLDEIVTSTDEIQLALEGTAEGSIVMNNNSARNRRLYNPPAFPVENPKE